jgi:PST family polysaccharide transporter
VILTDYGFGFTGVKMISIHRNNVEKVSEIFHSIQIIKGGILLLVLVVFTAAVFLLDVLWNDKEIYFLSYGILIGQTIVPVWFFQGMEKMKFITIINLLIRAGSVILIFILVKKPEDVDLAIVSQSISFVISGILSVIIAYKEFKLKFVIPKYSQIVTLFVSSRHMFFSTLSLSFYKNFNVVLLGFLTTNFEVGIYAAAERIIKAVHSLIAPMSQAIYPNLSLKFSQSTKEESIKKLKKISIYYIIPLTAIMVGMFITKGLVMRILGITNSEFVWVYYLLIPVILFGSLNYLLGIVGLVNLNGEKRFHRATIVGSIVNFAICLAFVSEYGAIAGAIALLSAEFLVLLMIVWYLNRLSKLPE